MEKSSRKRTREMSPTRSYADPVIVNNSDKETDTADEEHKDYLSPQSPPDHERGHQPLKYMPKFPGYTPPDGSSENTVFLTWKLPRKQLSPVQRKSKELDHVTHMTAPANACGDMDHFEDTDRQDTLRQQLDKEINGAPWHQDARQKALEEMQKVVKTVKPVYEGFWHQNDSDILDRLNKAAKKLKDRHAEMEKDIIKGAHQQEDQVTPSDKCVTCNHPIGQHMLECSKNTLQHELEEIIQNRPKIVHPFPMKGPQTPLMPLPSVPANFSVKLNKVAKMKMALPVMKRRWKPQ